MIISHPLIPRILSGLSIQRWNTFPRLRQTSALDHLSFVAHIGLLLIDIMREKGVSTYDPGIFLRKVLYSGFFTFMYSDINSEVKDRIAEKDSEMYRKLESNVWNELLTLELSDGIRADIADIQIKTPEDSLIAFSKIWASYYEVYNNSLVYPDAYARILKNIVKKSEKKEYSIFLEYLDFDPHNQTDTERYLLVIHRLISSFRWNKSVKRYPVSVLSHTYIITFFAYILGHEENLSKDDITDMMLTGLFHDIPEAITGDIITPTKKSIPGLDAIIESIEHELVDEHLLSYISGYEFQKVYSKKMLDPWNEPHGYIVKSADILSAYHEALLEAPYSEEFAQVVKRLEEKMNDR